MKKFLLGSLLCLCLASLPSCRKYHHPGENCKGACQSYQTKFIKGSTNNTLEILDWGGKGKPILFLTGLGNTAHVFVDFAPKFTDRFHVYVMSRRGYGASEQTKNGYGVDTLAKDILAVTTALQLNKVILIGHSIAGEEVSKFASSYPDKVDKVIYFDAAYDRTDPDLANFKSNAPAYPEPVTADFASFSSVKNFMARSTGVPMPDEEIRNSVVFSNDGRYLRNVTPDSINALILEGVQKPDYKNIKCPALSIYAIYSSASQMYAYYTTLDAENKKRAETSFAIWDKYAKGQREAFQNKVLKGTVKGITGANHYVFISHPVETEKFIREFLQ
jgi:non-heme chloroperoxidase